jgi:hypothetical protein
VDEFFDRAGGQQITGRHAMIDTKVFRTTDDAAIAKIFHGAVRAAKT